LTLNAFINRLESGGLVGVGRVALDAMEQASAAVSVLVGGEVYAGRMMYLLGGGGTIRLDELQRKPEAAAPTEIPVPWPILLLYAPYRAKHKSRNREAASDLRYDHCGTNGRYAANGRYRQ